MAVKTSMLVSTLLMISFLVAMQSMDMAFAGECENKCWSKCVNNRGQIDNRCYSRCILNNCRLPTLDLDSSGQPPKFRSEESGRKEMHFL
ncbi:hypothetical protein MLD38_040630 [Melastoma candidum]|nr:hypothetical protein MLD38_040630 [Melastoma candidum]